jgi:hypothetical protein
MGRVRKLLKALLQRQFAEDAQYASLLATCGTLIPPDKILKFRVHAQLCLSWKVFMMSMLLPRAAKRYCFLTISTGRGPL